MVLVVVALVAVKSIPTVGMVEPGVPIQREEAVQVEIVLEVMRR
tara:strand:+ start:453 stop:584 length:132 start_codon:yes stop_codon:yes gene_type:complete